MKDDKKVELVAKWQAEGCVESRNEVLMAHYDMVKSLANKMAYGNQEKFKDYSQVGTLGAMRGIDKFDPESGLAVSTYIYMWIKSYIGTYRNKDNLVNYCKSGGSDKESVSYIEDLEGFDVEDETKPDLGDFNRLLEKLPKKHQSMVAAYYAYGFTYKEIGEAWGISHQGVQDHIKRALKKLKEEFSE